ncbi:MAG: ABC transporter ATP-binding protein [Candidatus Brocadiaceae bacterium]|nr:ABC transporter ATP-binding protein [Candidatus Brocadiaceae bacterium]
MLEAFRKILVLLTRSERRQMYLLIAAIIISAFLELVGVTAIFPFLSVASNPDKIQQNNILKWFYDNVGFANKNSFLFTLGAAAFCMLVISNVFRALTAWGTFYFAHMRRHDVSKRLLSGYLYERYKFFLNRNSSVMTTHILSNVNSAIAGVLVPGMQILANILIALFIILLLIVMDPMLAMKVAFVLGGLYITVYLFVRKKLTYLGKIAAECMKEMFKILSEAFGGIKEVKIMSKEKFFLDKYVDRSKKYMRSIAISQTIDLLPKYVFETLAYGGVLLIVMYMIATKEGFHNAIPMIGLYAFSGFRLMPALQQILKGATRVRSSIPVLDMVYQDYVDRKADCNFDKMNPAVCTGLQFSNKIEFRNVTFSYATANEPAIRESNITIECNSTIGFVGATGSGKTTTIDILLGLLQPQAGEIIVDGMTINDSNLRAWQANIGYVPQHIFLSDDTITCNIAFGVPGKEIKYRDVEQSARVANIHDFIVSELPDGYETKVGERGVRLSGGQRQRIGIARALYSNPDILILDEATSSVDGIVEGIIMEAVHTIAHKKTIIIIAHRMSTVKECDKIYMMEKGRIIDQGKYDDLIRTNQQFRDMAKVNIT